MKFVSMLKGSRTSLEIETAQRDIDSLMIKHVHEEAFEDDYKHLQQNNEVRKAVHWHN